MSPDDLSARFRDLLVERFELNPADIHPDARLYEDLDLDSIDAIDLTIVIRELTDKKVTPQEFRDVRTVGDVEREIRRLLDAD